MQPISLTTYIKKGLALGIIFKHSYMPLYLLTITGMLHEALDDLILLEYCGYLALC